MNEKNYIERYWRDAKPEDAIKEPPMVARLRDNERQSWRIGKLTGCDRYPQFPEERWFIEKSCGTICQVYDAPDPGEGWRLIDASSETKQLNDEYLSYDGSWYRGGACFEKNLTYRRRITPAVTYVPFTWEDREQLRGRWVYRVHANGTRDERMLGYAQQAANGDIEFGGFFPDTLVREWKFLDTDKPVGKEVTQ